jgi:hypothetical protein
MRCHKKFSRAGFMSSASTDDRKRCAKRLQQSCCPASSARQDHCDYTSLECSACGACAIECGHCRKEYACSSRFGDGGVPWHKQVYNKHINRCSRAGDAGSGSGGGGGGGGRGSGWSADDDAEAGMVDDGDGGWGMDGNGYGGGGEDSVENGGNIISAPPLQLGQDPPPGLPLRHYSTSASAAEAVAASGLPAGTVLNPPGQAHWPPKPAFFGAKQPHTAVASAVFHGSGGQLHVDTVSDADAELVLRMRELYAGMQPAQRAQLAIVLGGVDRCARQDEAVQVRVAIAAEARAAELQRARTAEPAKVPLLLRQVHEAQHAAATSIRFLPPLTAAQLRNVLHGGRHSLSAALPVPRTHDLGDGHTVVEIADLIAIMLASNAPVSYINEWAGDTVQHTWQGRTAQRIRYHTFELHGEHLILIITEWSDDFEKNRCKQNRSSVHVVTMAIGKPTGPDTDDNVFVVSVSPKGLDHEPAFEHLRRQLEALATPQLFWHGGVQATVSVSARMAAKIADGPETYAKTGQTAACRRGYTGSTQVLADRLAPCELCAPHVLCGKVPPVCTECASWEYGHHVLRAKAPAPYPIPGAELQPSAVDFPYLLKAIGVVYDQLRDGEWTPAGATCLMENLKVPEKVRSRVLEVATGGGERWFPANWLSGAGDCGVRQANHISEPMHLWFLGASSLLSSPLSLLFSFSSVLFCAHNKGSTPPLLCCARTQAWSRHSLIPSTNGSRQQTRPHPLANCGRAGWTRCGQ